MSLAPLLAPTHCAASPESPRGPPVAPAGPPERHVYVHVPFCARRCTYCDFAITVRREVPVDEYLRAIGGELAIRRAQRDAPWRADTIYMGGGTPSALGAHGVAGLLATLRQWLTLTPDAEVTLEANPEDVDRARAGAWRAAGVTRVSLGAQSFDARTLAWMHRGHSPERIREAVAILRAAGIRDVSLDLIFAAPATLGRSWSDDLHAALSLAPEHLSLYGLTVEPGTALARSVARGTVHEAPEEAYEAEYLAAHDALGAAGYEHYEVSNFARPGHRACHNQAYWTGVPYLGIGPAAHSFDGETRRWNARAYNRWRDLALGGRDPVEGSERLTSVNRAEEEVYLSLRTLTGTVIRKGEAALAQSWIGAGWARIAGPRVVLTPTGWLRLDSLAVSMANCRSR